MDNFILVDLIKKFKQTMFELGDEEPSKFLRENYVIITQDQLEYILSQKDKE